MSKQIPDPGLDMRKQILEPELNTFKGLPVIYKKGCPKVHIKDIVLREAIVVHVK